jgi:hypothetical protein
MQRTADAHDPITETGLPQAPGVVDDATALDATVGVLEAHTPARSGARLSIEAPFGHTGLECGLKGRDQALKLIHGETTSHLALLTS